MGKNRKPYSKKYPMLDHIEWIKVEQTEEEENERIKEIARMLHRFMEENCKRRKSQKNNVFQKEGFKKSFGL